MPMRRDDGGRQRGRAWRRCMAAEPVVCGIGGGSGSGSSFGQGSG